MPFMGKNEYVNSIKMVSDCHIAYCVCTKEDVDCTEVNNKASISIRKYTKALFVIPTQSLGQNL